MKQEFNVTGMGCSGCVARVRQALLTLPDVTSAEVRLTEPQAVIESRKPVSPQLLQMTLHRVGHYTVRQRQSATVGR